MKIYFFFILLSICLLGSCNKTEANQIDILFSIAPSDTDLTINSSISQWSANVTAKDQHNSSYFARAIELSTTSLDTFLISKQISSGAFEISGFGIELIGAIISQEKEEIINTANNFSKEFIDFKIDILTEEGYKGKVIYELDIEKSLSVDADGNKVFEPFYTIKEL